MTTTKVAEVTHVVRLSPRLLEAWAEDYRLEDFDELEGEIRRLVRRVQERCEDLPHFLVDLACAGWRLRRLRAERSGEQRKTLAQMTQAVERGLTRVLGERVALKVMKE